MDRDPGYYSPEGFRDVLRGVWFSPRRFFGNLDPGGSLLRPVFFAAAVVYLVLAIEAVLRAVWVREIGYSLLYGLLAGLAVALFLGLLLVGAFTALVLVVLDGAPSRAKFGTLFRPLGYVAGVLIVLPIPYGPFLVLAYGPYVATVAVKETLGLSWKRAASATLIPLAATLLILLALLGPADAYNLLVNPPQN
ncbi:MAG: YIP1 family protein [Rubrobacteraceae bacterium]